MKKTSLFIILLLLLIVFSSCSKDVRPPTVDVIEPTLEITTDSAAEPVTQNQQDDVTFPSDFDNVEPPDENQTVTTIASEDVSDDDEIMLVSADPSNPFLNAVVLKYGVSPQRLVAFYASSMKKDANLVFEFDGTRDKYGKPVRDTSTLKNIYTVSASLEAKKATGTAAEGNEYSTKDSLYCEYFTKWVIFKVYANDIKNA